jgi:hypothetical protein
MRVERLICDHCRKPALALIAMNDEREVCPNCLPAVMSEATRHGLVGVRLEYEHAAEPVARMRARR